MQSLLTALGTLRDEFQTVSRQGPKLFHAMYRFRGISQFQPNNVPCHCGGPSIQALVDGFDVAFYYRQPETPFCQIQLTEFFRLAEAAARCIDPLLLPPYPPDDGVHLRSLLENLRDPRSQWLSAVYRLAWTHPGPLLRAEPSINGQWVGSEQLYAHHLLDECTSGTTWEVCVPLSPDVFLASALTIDILIEAAKSNRPLYGAGRDCRTKSTRQGQDARDPASEDSSMSSGRPHYTLGQLISDLESSESAYQENLQTAARVEAKDGHNLVSSGWRIQAAALLFQQDPARHPGVDRVKALCDEFGKGLTAENVRKIRGSVCRTLALGVNDANAMTLEAVTNTLGLATEERSFMEMAIDQARKSISEDERAHPKVGAVVVKDRAVVATAFRGELGKGEHAEYTALERKLPSETLAGATVYATLEPCTTRNHPKMPCAQRLIERKVKRVVIGMLDPNPWICGKGERLLRDHGIEVERFPHELVMQLEEMNRAFVRAQREADVHSPKQVSADTDAGLKELHRRFVEAQDRFPREVSFALVMIPHGERPAWNQADRWFDDPIGAPQKYGWKCLRCAHGADTAETITIPVSERTDGGTVPEVYPLEAWKCWLLRQSTTAEYPTSALNMFLSLAKDACRALDLRDCGQIIDGQRFDGKRGEFEYLLRWAIEQLPTDECQKMTWLDPPHEHVRTTPRPGHTPRRWMVEMPCVFATVAHALERHMRDLGKPRPPT
jgi:pyrimidine deaminase RibD-like protein